MQPFNPKPQRCAIYTCKSTEHNLDLAFNSLDAQREACEAYIKSQAHEGWTLVPDRFDDGGLSGASLDREALQELLSDIRLQKIDIIVVYKVDRLTRSLADFAKLVELFDEYGVSFVSVTQAFNTTSSMGRLTLNVLLSFAQFEREVIGERVRDKIAASKRKGIWVGGPVPFGYRVINKKLEIESEEAETIRTIFKRYIELGSIGLLVEDLDKRDIRTRRQILSTGTVQGGRRFSLGPLSYLLKNRCYIGEVAFKGEVYKGEHEAILDRALFNAVQARLAQQTVERKLTRSKSPSFLAGLIFDSRIHPMSPSHANKKGVRYRYYVSQALLQNRKAEAGPVSRVSAPDMEMLVCRTLREHLGTTRDICDRDLVRAHVERVVVNPKQIDITLNTNISAKFEDQISIRKGKDFEASGPSFAGPAILHVTWRPETFRAEKGIVSKPTSVPSLEPEIRDSLLMAIAKARSWVDDLMAGRIQSFKDIAHREKKGERYIRRLAALAFLSPRIVNAIAEGTAPADLSVTSLTRDLPISWKIQEDQIGMLRSSLTSGTSRRPFQGRVNPAIDIRSQMSGIF